MVWQTNRLLDLQPLPDYLWFVFFSTICSYNFHWWLTPRHQSPASRLEWIPAYRHFQLVLMTVSGIAAAIFFFRLWQFVHWIVPGVLLTFLYSAPKLPVKASSVLKRIAIGKTIYLSFVWTYVTTVLPLLIDGHYWEWSDLLFVFTRFFLIYAICIVFDFRDREQDKKEGIRSMITHFNERRIDLIFYLSLSIFFATALLLLYDFAILTVSIIVLPGILMAIIYPYSKKSTSDYLYFFVLDGLMMLSALVMLVIGALYRGEV